MGLNMLLMMTRITTQLRPKTNRDIYQVDMQLTWNKFVIC